MKSMTGYGEAAAQGRRAKIAVQIRNLNHRHLDVQLRVPREYLSMEEELRRAIGQKVSRGRVELFITRSPFIKSQNRRLELDEALLSQYLHSLRSAKRKFGLKGELDLSFLSNLPELFQLTEVEPSGEEEKGLVLRILSAALKNLEASREREGRQLTIDVQSHVKRLRKVCAGLRTEAHRISVRLKDSLSLKEGEGSMGTEREMAEAGNWISKGDINEELVRLKSHVEELGRLTRERKPVGKKMEFLLQEVLRELNTISSKAPQLPVVQLVLAGKEMVEKVREQAQNIE